MPTPTAKLSVFFRSRISGASLIAVILAHAGLFMWVLLTAPMTAMPITPPQPLTVSLIKPEVEELQPEPEPRPSLPKPAVKSLPPPPVLVAARPAPTPQQAVEAPTPDYKPDSKPEPAPEALPPPEPAPAPVAMAAQPAPPGPPIPPRPADYLNNPKPPYPALSRRLGEEGVVRLNILVNPDGGVERLKLAQSSGYQRLDQSAINIVQSSWKFEPARQDGKPVAAWVIVPIHFTLR